VTKPVGAVIAGLSGGLGNQMFQYAAARALAARQAVPLTLDLAWFTGRSDRAYALSGFSLPSSVSLHRPLIPDPFASLWSRASRRFSKRKMEARIYREPHFHFAQEVISLPSPIYLEGYWQSPRYFEDAVEIIRTDFALAEPLSTSRVGLRAKIEGAHAVSVHVRRGDYVTNATASAHHGTCSPEWYQTAMQSMIKLVENPTFFVFSDDPDWAQENLPQERPCVFVAPQTDGRDFEDMHLMALCDHHIIANSSFSWWGAWLNPSAEKRVIAPLHWFAQAPHDTRDLIPQGWLRL
jgi:hypothetical protein